MDLQEYIKNSVAAARAGTLADSDQLTLGELILKLEAIEPNQKKRIEDGKDEARVWFDFEYMFPFRFSSWRGAYQELALEFAVDEGEALTLTQFLNLCKETVGKTFTGWKGGEYKMGRRTPVWVARQRNAGSTALIDVIDDGYTIYLITGLREY